MKLQDKTGAARRAAMIRLSPLAASLLLMLAGPAVATESTQTLHLVGNKPVASNVMLSPAAPKAGELVTAKWSYTDEDGDKESGSTVEWLIGGTVVAGQWGSQYTLPKDSGGKSLQVKVTTKSAAPAVPATGDPVSSTSVTIGPAWNGPAVVPPSSAMNWDQANAHCQSLGARLPNRTELIDVWKRNTSGKGPNTEMCDIHKWPLNFLCEGGSYGNYYWTNEMLGGSQYSHHFVDMRWGTTPSLSQGFYDNKMIYNVVCMR